MNSFPFELVPSFVQFIAVSSLLTRELSVFLSPVTLRRADLIRVSQTHVLFCRFSGKHPPPPQTAAGRGLIHCVCQTGDERDEMQASRIIQADHRWAETEKTDEVRVLGGLVSGKMSPKLKLGKKNWEKFGFDH